MTTWEKYTKYLICKWTEKENKSAFRSCLSFYEITSFSKTAYKDSSGKFWGYRSSGGKTSYSVSLCNS